MRKYIVLIIALLLSPGISYAGGMNDDPLLTMLVVEQLEIRDTDKENPLVWEAEGWIGKDLHKLWIKTEGEYVDDRTEEMELQMLYSRAVAPFWDLQLGWRRNFRPTPERDWLAFGFKGLAPYYFDVDVALFVGDAGRTAARLQAEYEFMLTQKLVLILTVMYTLLLKMLLVLQLGLILKLVSITFQKKLLGYVMVFSKLVLL